MEYSNIVVVGDVTIYGGFQPRIWRLLHTVPIPCCPGPLLFIILPYLNDLETQLLEVCVGMNGGIIEQFVTW